ncbi:SDR family NAD(P)-dependent oxidoreductase [Ilumatobacter nonamiensis]|uniref:SDR family NAD(P)-dependent oxidoreductase n=1 Tax=Ilumatobacter nonamiensis TaxID=467093 RepID=UPI0003476AB4|nr:SDR family oxidoreductase [Ilumatobacter nonamiensis]
MTIIEPRLQSDLLADRVAIVTGGSRGIGGATSTMLAANGAKVVIAEVDAAKAEESVATLNDAYGAGTASAFVADLVAPDSCDRLVAHTRDTFGGSLDIVVNNAGYAWDGGIHSMTDEQFQAMLDIHLVVPFRLARATAPVFRELAGADGDRDDIYRKTVMVSSMAGQWGLQGAGNYAAAKAGMLGLMRTMSQEWGKYRVCVNAVAFGIIQTRFGLPQSEDEVIEVGGRTVHVGMPAKQAERRGVSLDEKPTEEQMYASQPVPNAMVPLGRTGNIRDAAESIFWLCSPLSDYVTGQTLVVSGGAKGGMS